MNQNVQAYLRDVVPMRIKNRLYVSWQNPSGMVLDLQIIRLKFFRNISVKVLSIN